MIAVVESLPVISHVAKSAGRSGCELLADVSKIAEESKRIEGLDALPSIVWLSGSDKIGSRCFGITFIVLE
jgi:hypothetical protein